MTTTRQGRRARQRRLKNARRRRPMLKGAVLLPRPWRLYEESLGPIREMYEKERGESVASVMIDAWSDRTATYAMLRVGEMRRCISRLRYERAKEIINAAIEDPVKHAMTVLAQLEHIGGLWNGY